MITRFMPSVASTVRTTLLNFGTNNGEGRNRPRQVTHLTREQAAKIGTSSEELGQYNKVRLREAQKENLASVRKEFDGEVVTKITDNANDGSVRIESVGTRKSENVGDYLFL